MSAASLTGTGLVQESQQAHAQAQQAAATTAHSSSSKEPVPALRSILVMEKDVTEAQEQAAHTQSLATALADAQRLAAELLQAKQQLQLEVTALTDALQRSRADVAIYAQHSESEGMVETAVTLAASSVGSSSSTASASSNSSHAGVTTPASSSKKKKRNKPKLQQLQQHPASLAEQHTAGSSPAAMSASSAATTSGSSADAGSGRRAVRPQSCLAEAEGEGMASRSSSDASSVQPSVQQHHQQVRT